MKRISAKGLSNLRDLGGIRAADGRRVREGLFFRSDSLHRIGPLTCSLLRDKLHVATIIDLRTPLEMEEKPDIVVEGVESVAIPIFDESAIGITRESGADYGKFIRHSTDRQAIRAIIPDMMKIYSDVMAVPQIVSKIALVLQTMIANAQAGRATLFHCSQGKDRTGAVSSLLLALLGVDRSTIWREYSHTNRIVGPKALRDSLLVLLFKLDPKAAWLVWKASIADADYMRAAFQTIDRLYGSPEQMFRDIMGISDSQRDALRNAALE